MMKVSTSRVPSYDSMFIPTIQALQELGGSATTDEIYEKVVQILGLTDEVLEVQHGDTSQTEVEYRLAWSRTYLKKYGLLQNSVRGVWSLTSTEIKPKEIKPKEIVRLVRETHRKSTSIAKSNNGLSEVADEVVDEVVTELSWHEQLRQVLLSLQPAAFERLAQRLLRESGFVQVNVTGRSGDGGIDGVGIARVNGFLSFHVMFQCKRYQRSVTPSEIRDFRGAMQGRTDKGLFITTGTFTREATKEATRDGAPPIDLIDGEQLIQRLKELKLGVSIKVVESVEVDEQWFKGI